MLSKNDVLCGVFIMGLSLPLAWADSPWKNYKGVDTTKPRPPHAHKPPLRPPHGQRPPQWSQRPNNPGLSIQYQAPTTIIQNTNQYSWVNGQPAGRISSSTSTFISDWQRLGLPAPPNGMYWIHENGRYVLVPNN